MRFIVSSFAALISICSLEFGNLQQLIYEDLAFSIEDSDGLGDTTDVLDIIDGTTEKSYLDNSQTSPKSKMFLVSFPSFVNLEILSPYMSTYQARF